MSANPAVLGAPTGPLTSQVVVVGSGPGGAITAALLAEAGRQVILIEEGEYLPLESCAPFSLQEMEQKYRAGGLTPALGKTKVAYVEGRCVGGGSEINSGLYHRTPPEVLERWRKEFQVQALEVGDILPHFEACEQDVSVSYLPTPAPLPSLKLHQGATQLGWKSLEIPRWFKYETGADGRVTGTRQSMTRTFIPRLLAAGGRLLPQTRIHSLRNEEFRWRITGQHANGTAVELCAEALFICGGAVQTPALLRRSGIKRNIGNSLQLHPTVKLIAGFNEIVNSADMGVPVHQVKEFAPRLSFGCSISSAPYLALGMTDHPAYIPEAMAQWQKLAIYYAMITTESRGTVRCLPGFRDPLVRYAIRPNDLRQLSDGLRKLSELLLSAGATVLYPSVTGLPPLTDHDSLGKIPACLPANRTNLMTIHLFSSCPMGENQDICAADSFGRVFDQPNLYIADGSLLCTAPGVNPQGSIMAIARRNALKYLGKI